MLNQNIIATYSSNIFQIGVQPFPTESIFPNKIIQYKDLTDDERNFLHTIISIINERQGYHNYVFGGPVIINNQFKQRCKILLSSITVEHGPNNSRVLHYHIYYSWDGFRDDGAWEPLAEITNLHIYDNNTITFSVYNRDLRSTISSFQINLNK